MTLVYPSEDKLQIRMVMHTSCGSASFPAAVVKVVHCKYLTRLPYGREQQVKSVLFMCSRTEPFDSLNNNNHRDVILLV